MIGEGIGCVPLLVSGIRGALTVGIGGGGGVV